MLNRRRFLKNSALVSLAPTLPAFLSRSALAAPDSKAENGRILVVIQLDGGNDGINTVVPFKDEGYAKHRDELRLPEKDLIKSGGYRIGAGEVETALLGHPGVKEAAVVGLPDADLGQRIVAFVVGDGLDEQALIDHVASQLSVHKRPREVRLVESLPRNAMGKVQKKLL